ncbi:hypothetical protein NC651_019213 [Populus alba x Populus x berolinensis]|nr:hypothetical protein NC651_019213 [Populus alba x Populus x berolinensis]
MITNTADTIYMVVAFFCLCSLASKNLCIASFHKFCCHLMYIVCVFFVTYRSHFHQPDSDVWNNISS